jgi:general secretion pathway protein H
VTRRTAYRSGVTLLEVLIVVTLIAILSGSMVFGSGMLGSNRLRASATLVASGIRLGITRANATGKPVRLVFDLDKQRMSLEESTTSVALRDKSDAIGASGANRAAMVEKRAHEEAERVVEGTSSARASFVPVKQFSDEGAVRELGSGIRFRKVQTEHDEQAKTDGEAYLYFWPGGETEHCVIQLFRGGKDPGLSISVSPLTGRTKIERGSVDLPIVGDDGEISERQEE